MQKVSMCIIVKNDPVNLENCIKSFKDYIDELVIVDTGSTDNQTQQIAQQYADKFEIFTECNDPITGLINDFSLARQKSLELATNSIVMWIDSDDIIFQPENIKKLLQDCPPSTFNSAICFMLPYEYSYDNKGNCTCVHYRERLVTNKDCFKFVNAVHEVLIPKEGMNINFITSDDVIYKHQRQFTNKVIESGRNLRILENYIKDHSDDARQYYYIGLEYFNVGKYDQSYKSLEKYVSFSGWDDEKTLGCLKIVDIFFIKGQYEEALPWAFKAVETKEDWGECYFALAKIFYFLAQKGGDKARRNWEKCVHFAKIGLTMPPTKTLLFVNPLDREVDIHRYLNVALNNLGQVAAALESVNIALLKEPEDNNLLNNKKLYEIFLCKQNIMNNINFLKDNKEINNSQVELIIKLLNNQIQANLLTEKSNFIFPESKNNGLDIIIFTGNAPSIWNPKTVKENGIGGSELMALQQAKNLATLGNKVRIYNNCGKDNEGIYDGVEYHETENFHDLTCDVLIISRQADMLSDRFNIFAKLKILWLHDVIAINATNELLLKADRIFALSNWHKNNLISHHNLHTDHIITTRNGINLNRFNKKIVRNRFKCINTSSPDRSWPILLDIWPEIKKQVPQAELHLAYGFANWEISAQMQNDKSQLSLINFLKNKIKELQSAGVVFHDRLNQEKLAEEFLSAGVLLYPTWFTETSCISAMEAQAAGLRIVTSNIAALKETVADRGVLIDGQWTSPEYQNKFIEEAVKALTNEDESDRVSLQQYAENFSLDTLAKDWEKLFYNLLEEIKTNPIIPYCPTQAYK